MPKVREGSCPRRGWEDQAHLACGKGGLGGTSITHLKGCPGKEGEVRHHCRGQGTKQQL